MYTARSCGLRRFARSLSVGGVAWGLGRDCEPCTFRGLRVSTALPIRGAGVLRCEGSAPDRRWAFKPEYRGQLTPSRPSPMPSPLAMHGGPFGARWLRVGPAATPSDVTKALTEAADGATAALYVGVPDDYQSSGPIVAELRRQGFKFHHVSQSSDASVATPNEMIYYRWTGSGPDTVPAYSTALEGVGVMLLSPDEKEILLVWEYGHWKMLTGNVDVGDSLVDTVRREVREEVGLELEEEGMHLVGGWQDARSRDKIINNAFFVLTAKAQSRDVKVDGVEIQQARWFPLDSLPSIEDEQKASQVANKPFGMEWGSGIPGQTMLSRTVVRFLNVYIEGRGLRLQSKKGTNYLERRDLFV